MKLIVPRITDSTTPKDLRAFANQILEKIFRLPFSAQPRIVNCRILSITDKVGVIERHGLITVTPDDAGLRIIRKLNGTYLKGKRVGVKVYQCAADGPLEQRASLSLLPNLRRPDFGESTPSRISAPSADSCTEKPSRRR